VSEGLVSHQLQAVPLDEEQLVQVFPLVRSVAPDLELAAWQGFARRYIGESSAGGIVGIRDERGYFHGLFGYRVRAGLSGGKTLEVDWATAMELLDRTGPAPMLIEAIEAIAARLDCAELLIHLKPGQRRLRRWFEGVGHSVQAVVLGRAVEGRPS
jgi:hypothetical protein